MGESSSLSGFGRPRTAWRWALAGSLILAEYLLISTLFDAAPLREAPGVIQLLGYTGVIVPLVIAFFTALVLVGGAAFWRDVKGLAGVPVKSSRFGIWLTVHGVAFVAFVLVTQELFGNADELSLENLHLLTAAWVATGVLTVASLMNSLVPVERLWGVARRNLLAIGAAGLAGVLAWGAALASEFLWPPLSQITLSVVVAMLRVVSADVTYGTSPPNVSMNDFSIVIAPICSGYAGVGLIIVFTSLYFWFARHRLRFPGVLLLIPLGITAVWLGNALRIAALVAIGAWWSPEIALGGFHSKAGWVLFSAIAVAIAAIAEYSSVFAKDTRVTQDTWNPTAAYLVPLLALIAVSMVGGLFVAGFNSVYPIQILAAIVALACYRGYFRLSWSWSWSPAAIGVAVFLGWIALEKSPDSEVLAAWSESFSALPPWVGFLWLVSRVLGSVLIVPVVEELAFRGYLMRRLMSPNFTEVLVTRVQWVPLLISSLAFGFLHQHFLAGVMAGIGYGIALTLRGRLGDAILAHAVTNGLIALYVLATGSWSLWI